MWVKGGKRNRRVWTELFLVERVDLRRVGFLHSKEDLAQNQNKYSYKAD